MTVDLRALANRPGYGKSIDALKDAGLWDEFAGQGPTRPFTVHLTMRPTPTVHGTITVQARCRAEAARRAQVGDLGLIDWDFDMDWTDVEVFQVIDSTPSEALSEPDDIGRSDKGLGF